MLILVNNLFLHFICRFKILIVSLNNKLKKYMKTEQLTRLSLELYNLAKHKGSQLKMGEQIWLTEDEHTWIVLNYFGTLYIGYDVDSPVGKFFKTKEVLEMTNKGVVVTYFQKLY